MKKLRDLMQGYMLHSQGLFIYTIDDVLVEYSIYFTDIQLLNSVFNY